MMDWRRASFKADISHFFIEGFARLQQFLDAGAWVRCLQQRPVTVSGHATVQLVYGGTQVHYDTAIFDDLAIGLGQNGPAPRCQHNTGLARTNIEHRRFAFAEPLLAFELKDSGHSHTATGFQLVVQVHKLALEFPRQLTTNGRFTGTHHAHQNNGTWASLL